MAVVVLTFYIVFKRPIVDGWAKGYWHLWFEAWDSENAVLWDSLAKGTTCSTFSLNEPTLMLAFEQILPDFQTLDEESKFIEHSATLLTRLLETTFSRQRLPITNADWTRIDNTQPLMQALACCPRLSRGAIRMTEILALPSSLLSRTNTGALIVCLDTFMLNANHTRHLLHAIRDGSRHKQDWALRSLQRHISDAQNPSWNLGDLLEQCSSSVDDLANSVKKSWKPCICAIEQEIKPDLERLEDRTFAQISQIESGAMLATSQTAAQFQILLGSVDRRQKSLEHEFVDAQGQIQILETSRNLVSGSIDELDQVKSDRLEMASKYAYEIAGIPSQEEIPMRLEQLELEQKRSDCLRSIEQVDTQRRRYQVELGQLAAEYNLLTQKTARLGYEIREADREYEKLRNDWQNRETELLTEFSEKKHQAYESESNEKKRIRREIRGLKANRGDLLNAIKDLEEEYLDTGKLPQALANLYKEIENRLVEGRKYALQVALDDVVTTVDEVEAHLAHTSSVMKRMKFPVRPLRVDTSYCLPIWIIAFRESASSPVSYNYTTLAHVRQKRKLPFGREIELHSGPWATLQEEVNKRLNELEEKMGHFLRGNPVTRHACWCILQELKDFKAKEASGIWIHFLAVALTMRIVKGQPWQDQIVAIKNVLRGRYDLITVPQTSQ